MKSLVGNTWINSKTEQTIEVINPTTNNIIDTVPQLTEEEIHKSIDYAYNHQNNWYNISIYEKGKILEKFNELINKNKDELSKTLSEETGLPIKYAHNEISNLIKKIKSYIEISKHENELLFPRGKEEGEENIIRYKVQEPLGVIASIISYNDLNNEFINKVIPALLTGNAVIINPTSIAPLTITKYVELLIESGIPKGILSVVHGNDELIYNTISTNNKVSKIVTSNKKTNVINPFILCEDGDIDLAVEETIKGRLYNAGQSNKSNKIFLINNKVKKEYIDKLIKKIDTLKIGYPSDMKADIGSLINEKTAIEVENKVNKIIQDKGKLIFGGRRKETFFEPTIIENTTKEINPSEIYGPVIEILMYDNLDDIIDIINKTSNNLLVSIITKNINNIVKASDKIKCKEFIVNGTNTNISLEQTLKYFRTEKTVIIKNLIK